MNTSVCYVTIIGFELLIHALTAFPFHNTSQLSSFCFYNAIKLIMRTLECPMPENQKLFAAAAMITGIPQTQRITP